MLNAHQWEPIIDPKAWDVLIIGPQEGQIFKKGINLVSNGPWIKIMDWRNIDARKGHFTYHRKWLDECLLSSMLCDFDLTQSPVTQRIKKDVKSEMMIPVNSWEGISVQKFILDPLLRDDYNTGDKNGPFDPNVVKGRRAIAQLVWKPYLLHCIPFHGCL